MILVLGGTAEARALAAALVAAGYDVTSSLAGRVARPALPVGTTRIGGFGGVDGLVAWLRENRPSVVVDATHPFAARISAHAAAACSATGTPVLRLARAGWTERPGDRWVRVRSVAAAAAALPELGGRPFLTTGRGGLELFAARPVVALARCVDPPDLALPPAWTVRLDRGPYTLDAERALLAGHRADVLVTKDSGGSLTVAKLDAARELGLPVLMVDRPAPPDVATVADVDAAVRWVTEATRPA